ISRKNFSDESALSSSHNNTPLALPTVALLPQYPRQRLVPPRNKTAWADATENILYGVFLYCRRYSGHTAGFMAILPRKASKSARSRQKAGRIAASANPSDKP
ncbi:MAG: hypothetical protein VB032_06470, partial [Burkholderiaceae bacterium]|nr:hypothetical protein [Burkholderiaceae bacterium]